MADWGNALRAQSSGGLRVLEQFRNYFFKMIKNFVAFNNKRSKSSVEISIAISIKIV